MHVEFTLTSNCPLKCDYCPQQKYINSYKKKSGCEIMSLKDYKFLLSKIDHLTENIDFSGYTEPLSNPSWDSIFEHTISEGYSLTLYSTLYNTTIEDIEKLTSLYIKKFYIHLVDSEIYLPRYKYFVEKCKKQNLDFTLVYFKEEGEKMAAYFHDLTECEQWSTHSRAGTLRQSLRYAKGAVTCCEERFLCNVVLPNGDVHVCCMDFPLYYKIGNLFEKTLSEIHRSDKLKRFYRKMQSKEDNLCNHCIYAIPI
jgi:radical SAM protein with 4Fe4S-binding SPASM domain